MAGAEAMGGDTVYTDGCIEGSYRVAYYGYDIWRDSRDEEGSQ